MYKNKKILAIIQTHSIDWEGRKDISLKKINGNFVIEKVIDKVKKIGLFDKIIISAPDILENKIFERIAKKHGIFCYLGENDNVVSRLYNTAKKFEGEAIFLTLGQYLLIDTDLIKKMTEYFIEGGYEFVCPPDDFSINYCGRIFRAGALKKIIDILGNVKKNAILRIRPANFIKEHPDLFNLSVFEDVPKYGLKKLKKDRKAYSKVSPPEYVDAKKIHEASSAIYRYEFAKQFISSKDTVLDIASGTGFGADFLADYAKTVIGADQSKIALNKANTLYKKSNLSFKIDNALKLSFPNNYFDKVISMETFEHIQPEKINEYCHEMKRVLKKEGIFISWFMDFAINFISARIVLFKKEN